MAGSSAAPSSNAGYWSFLDGLVETEPVREVRLMRSKGDALIAGLRRCPVVGFGSFEINFNDDLWDFTGVTDLNIKSSYLKLRFERGPMAEEIKLYAITNIVRRRVKVQTVKARVRLIEKAVAALGLEPGTVRMLGAEHAEGFLHALGANLSASSLGLYASSLADMLEFHEMAFGSMSDPDLIPRVREIALSCARVAAASEGTPRIPEPYEESLLQVAADVMRDGGRSSDLRITAAAMIVMSELGFRAGELLGLESGALEVVDGVAGMPDIAYLTFKTYKGHVGNGSYAVRRTVVSAGALEACLTLEGLCGRRRAELGVRTLIVYPRQKSRFFSVSSLDEKIRQFLVAFSGAIPCVGTGGDFPELPTMTVEAAVRGRRWRKSIEELGLDPEDELVYVTSHMFRVSFATRLYERGYDLAIIARFMNHISTDMTAGYVRAERDVEREMSDAVYRAVLVDEAELIGPYGAEFSNVVKEYASSLAGTVHPSEDELIAACSERYPLRLKPGYVCTKCGNVRGCPSDSGTDEVFCAFGVCRNQHHMYFMVDVHVDAVRFHMRLVEENRARGHTMAAKNELRKAMNVIEGTVLPELESLDEQLALHGAEHILGRHPHLRRFVLERASVSEEVEAWLSMRVE